jgi:UDP-N-acetylmuramoylalanine--D-glutamate ligase
MKLDELKNRDVVVWGLGKEGLAILPHLIEQSPTKVTLIDINRETRESAAIASFIETCAQRKIPVELLEQDLISTVKSESVIIKSPGISRYDESIQQLKQNNCVITSGTDIWLGERNGQRVIGVTGSKGKSTTASLVAHILNNHHVDAIVAGNIGTPLIEISDKPDTWVAAEISSFQAADVSTSPEIGILTSLFPEHSDWHRNYENYASDKLRLFAWPTNQALFVNGADTEVVTRTNSFIKRHVVNIPDGVSWHNNETIFYKGGVLAHAYELAITGPHNLTNVVLAIAAADFVHELDVDSLRDALASFHGLPHRLQTIGELNGAIVVDDGLATNSDSCVAALNVYKDKKIAVFLGGFDRGLDYTAVGQALRDRTNPLLGYLMGPAGEKIRSAFEAAGGNQLVFLQSIESLGIGIKAIAQSAQNYEVVLLSPGAASFNEFKNYEERSQVFYDEMVSSGMKPVET